MVIVIARVRPKPESREDLLALLAEVEAASRTDDGCLNYGYYAGITDADDCVAVEEWRDEEALRAHLTTPHVRRLVEALPGLIDGAPSIIAHEIASSGPLPLG